MAAFNKDEQLDQKYNVAVNTVQPRVSRKRDITEISASTHVACAQEPEMQIEEKVPEEPKQKRFNPFAKNVDTGALEEEIKAQDEERAKA